MPQPPVDPVLIGFQGGVLLASILTWMYLLAVWQRGPLLQYQPRRPVPWGPAASVLVVFFVLMALSTWAATSGQPEQQTKPTVDGIVLGLIMYATMIAGVFVVLVVTSDATWRDLGLPSSARELGRDIVIGIVACLAALLPVHLIQLGLVYAFKLQDQPSGHELVKLVTEGEPNGLILLLAGVAAVIVAPFCEEIAFRLLFQGWLEKWELERLNWREPERGQVEVQVGVDSPSMSNVAQVETSAESSLRLDSSVVPPPRGVAWLPYGLLPILMSSGLFGLAHFGYGPEPVPLFFLGLVLGYVYQRTHRIVPCIVTHALFNAFTMFVLWRVVFHGAE